MTSNNSKNQANNFIKDFSNQFGNLQNHQQLNLTSQSNFKGTENAGSTKNLTTLKI